jgi:hypothetical protein
MKADFDIGNLVYVILTIVFLVIGAMGKKKKPIPQASDEESPEVVPEPDNIKSQFQELFRELNPATDLIKQQEYYFSPKETVEEGTSLDVVPDLSNESVEDIIPPETQPVDSNINYNDQAQSSLDTSGMDEGTPAFDYDKDHSSLVYNDLTKEYSTVLSDQEEEMVSLVDDFDPKTAFIYSQIFNRKEF